jgi:MinD-like ATPase involved in chromosome partitioning or flagellar assembly
MSGQLESLRAFVSGGTGRGHRVLENVVVVAGGKGGVGVSTVSALIAAAAARRGRATLLVDAAPSAASLRAVLGLAGDESSSSDGMPYFVAPNQMFATLHAEEVRGAGERRARLRRIAAHYRDYELVVVDAGAAAEGVAAALAAGAGRLLAVATPDRLAVVATYALVKFVSEHFPELPVPVLFNRTEPTDATRMFGLIAAGAEEFLGRTLFPAGTLPEDDALRAAAEAGVSPAESTGSAAHAAALLAELLLHTGSGRQARPFLLNTT